MFIINFSHHDSSSSIQQFMFEIDLDIHPNYIKRYKLNLIEVFLSNFQIAIHKKNKKKIDCLPVFV